jgi:hypothetical protein
MSSTTTATISVTAYGTTGNTLCSTPL